MSKDKKKKKKYQGDGMYPQSMMDDYADTLEAYIDIYDRFIIKDGVDEEEYQKALKTIKKAIKNLRKGNGNDVFDPERYEEMVSSGR